MNKGFLSKRKTTGLFGSDSAPRVVDTSELVQYGSPQSRTNPLLVSCLKKTLCKDVRRRLDPVPVFVLAFANEPVLQIYKHPRASAPLSVAFLYLSAKDAQESLSRMRSKNAELARSTAIVVIHLEEAVELYRSNAQSAQARGYVFRFYVNSSQAETGAVLLEARGLTEEAQELRRSCGEGMFAESSPNIIPLFMSNLIRISAGQGSPEEGNQQVPLFFAMSDLERAIKQLHESGEKGFSDISDKTRLVDVGFLHKAVAEMDRLGSSLDINEQWGQIVFYPADESTQYVQKIEKELSEREPELQYATKGNVIVDSKTLQACNDMDSVRDKIMKIQDQAEKASLHDIYALLRVDCVKLDEDINRKRQSMERLVEAATAETKPIPPIDSVALSLLAPTKVVCHRDLDTRIGCAVRELDLTRSLLLRRLLSVAQDDADKRSQRDAVRILSNLLDEERWVSELRMEGGIGLMASLVEEDSDPEVKRHAAACLTRFCATPDGAQKVLAEQSLKPLVDLLNKTDNSTGQENAARALCKLADVSDRVRQKIVKAEGVLPLLPLLKWWNSDLQRTILKALSLFVLDGKYLADLAKGDVIKAVAPSLKHRDADMVRYASQIVCAFSVLGDYHSSLEQEGVVKGVVEGLKWWSSDEGLRNTLLDIVTNMTGTGGPLLKKYVDENIINAVLPLAKVLTGDRLLQVISLLLRIAQSDDDFRSRLVSCSTVSALMPLSKVDPVENSDLFKDVAYILQYLAIKGDHRGKIIYEGGVDILMTCSKASLQATRLSSAITLSLLTLAPRDRRRVLDAGALEVITRVGDSPDVSFGKDFLWASSTTGLQPIVELVQSTESTLAPVRYLAVAYLADLACNPDMHLRMVQDGAVNALYAIVSAPTHAPPPTPPPSTTSSASSSAHPAPAPPQFDPAELKRKFVAMYARNALVKLAANGFGVDSVRMDVQQQVVEVRERETNHTANLQRQITEAKGELAKTRAARDELMSRIAQLEIKAAETSAAKDKELKAAAVALEKASKEHELTKKKLAFAVEGRKSAAEEGVAMVQQKLMTLENELGEREKEVQALQEKVSQLEGELETSRSALTGSTRSLADDLERSRSDLAVAKKKLDAALQEVEKVQSEKSQLLSDVALIKAKAEEEKKHLNRSETVKRENGHVLEEEKDVLANEEEQEQVEQVQSSKAMTDAGAQMSDNEIKAAEDVTLPEYNESEKTTTPSAVAPVEEPTNNNRAATRSSTPVTVMATGVMVKLNSLDWLLYGVFASMILLLAFFAVVVMQSSNIGASYFSQ